MTCLGCDGKGLEILGTSRRVKKLTEQSRHATVYHSASDLFQGRNCFLSRHPLEVGQRRLCYVLEFQKASKIRSRNAHDDRSFCRPNRASVEIASCFDRPKTRLTRRSGLPRQDLHDGVLRLGQGSESGGNGVGCAKGNRPPVVG